MNALRSQLLALLAGSSRFVSLARADVAAYAKILKERDAVLSQIVAHRESLLASGPTPHQA